MICFTNRPRKIFFPIFIFALILNAARCSQSSSLHQNRVCWQGPVLPALPALAGRPGAVRPGAVRPGHCVNVEVALSDQDLRRGLQGRNSLKEDAGMLFIFPRPGLYNFWMKDTLISLDIIWLDENQTVIFIAENLPRCFKDPCPVYGPQSPSRYVLEVNAGYAKKTGLRIGDDADFQLKE